MKSRKKPNMALESIYATDEGSENREKSTKKLWEREYQYVEIMYIQTSVASGKYGM